MSSLASTPSHCPLCGQANQCAIAAGLPPESCWCMQTSIDPAALERIAPQQRRKQCICPACGQGLSPTGTPNP
ncbi:MAG: cysteine-rich CWC family protein [Comamonas sp.]|nr:cysteine-rich CWC family protein [Comamonas sp.]